MARQSLGYRSLLAHNTAFRRIWYGQLVSQLGDWFDSIALYALIYRLTGSGQAIGTLLVAQFLPAALVGPWAGVLVDRLPRKYVMIAADLGRAALVLLFLLVHDVRHLWIIYLVTVLKNMLTACFEPARGAAIPLVVAPEELVAANGISGATWSVMLAVGAGLGGFVAGTLGTNAAFLLDSATFLVSAAVISTVSLREQRHAAQDRRQPVRDLRNGLAFLRQHRDLALYASCKGLWSMAGGVIVVLTLFGQRVFPLGQDGALSTGVLYAARGLGAALGPLLAQYLGGSEPAFLRRAIGPMFILSTFGYLALSQVQGIGFAFVAVVLAHMGGSVIWTFSAVLLQMRVPDQLRGRIFSVDFTLQTLTTAISSYAVGIASDAGWTPRALAIAMAIVFLLPGLVLTPLLWHDRLGGEGVHR